VEIRFGAHGHSFEILSDQAYDHIDPAEASRNADAFEGTLLYHGSLALRGRVSRAALDRVRSASALPAFVDINLRPPWWDGTQLLDLLAGATWLKLNDEELAILADLVGTETDDREAMARVLADRFAIDLVFVTLGPEGAMAIERDGDTLWAAPEGAIRVADTVGAGDAFASVVVLGLMHGWPLPLVLGRAQAFAGVACGWRGATHRDRAIYASQLALWEDDDA
jgi:fructokinase